MTLEDKIKDLEEKIRILENRLNNLKPQSIDSTFPGYTPYPFYRDSFFPVTVTYSNGL